MIICAALAFLTESLLEPKIRTVPLEGVPTTNEPPDVTFMLGASMDPLVQTNPFLVVFSPLERVTSRIRMRQGSLSAESDRTVIFVWDVFGRQTLWQLDRQTHRLRTIPPSGLSKIVAWFESAFPMLTAMATGRKDAAADRRG